MPAQRIGSWLASGDLGALCSKTKRLTELQQVFLAFAPPPLAQACRVKSCRAGTLFLLADNAAVATKLKQLAPRLLVSIQKREPEITGIRVQVQVKEKPREPQRCMKKRPLSAETIENFRRLAGAVPESALKSALTNLVRRHRRSG
ncbi:MAG: DUF721 domain-containing protein [Betaproteobacteria bacterium]|nr:DUF721 domain-containing protein [Betaproteobacteria bacterium]